VHALFKTGLMARTASKACFAEMAKGRLLNPAEVRKGPPADVVAGSKGGLKPISGASLRQESVTAQAQSFSRGHAPRPLHPR